MRKPFTPQEDSTMTVTDLINLLEPVTSAIGGSPVDAALADLLNREFPPGSDLFERIEAACHQGVAEGWMCARGAPGRRYGRVVEPDDATSGLSVDVVELIDIVGPHHRHPNGEICMVMPVSPDARFDGHDRGWCVYPPGSAHFPTVTGGEALILYMLPDGAIEFTGKTPSTE